MPPVSHAAFSPSSAARYLACPPALRLGERYPDTPSIHAAEGSEAHEYGEYFIRKELGEAVTDPSEHLTMLSQEMIEHAEAYRDFVMEQFAEARRNCPDARLFVELPVSFDQWVEGGRGTTDAVIIADGMLIVIDLKYGKGVRVDAKGNPQLRLYALGTLQTFGELYEVRTVRMAVFQPRLANVSIDEMTAEELLDWAENILKPRAKMALAGEGDYCAGEWCRWCRARHVCRARAEANLRKARHDFALPPTLEDAEIETLLAHLDEIESWASDIREYALKQALSGKAWNGFKVVEGRAIRKYADEEKVALTVKAAGYEPYCSKLLGITEMQKLLGKKQFEDLLGDLLVRPKGKPVLVPEDDKRPEFSTAKTDFSQEI